MYSPTGTGTGTSHSGASVKPVPHQAAASGEEYAVTSKVVKPKEQPKPMEEYAMVDKSKKTAANPQGVSYIDRSCLCVYTLNLLCYRYIQFLYYLGY